ncbi:MAG: FtsX-like permease family protein, partial [Fulvivirga sp.]
NTLGVNLIEGRNFNEMTLSDTSVIILNETAVRALGFEKPIGKRIQFGGSPGNFEIVGVVKDFHHQSFRKQVPPTAFVYSKYTENALAVRLSAGDVSAKLLALESIWKENTLQPFDYSFVDADFGRLFEEEQRLSKIVAAFTFLAFFVACLGILGLAGYLAERKTKEIGIRKVLGATVEQIVTLFSQQFIRLVFIAMLIAVPLSYYASSAWLNSYVYKVNIDPLGFVIICLSGLAIVVVAVSYHAIKSGSANPVNALKEE